MLASSTGLNNSNISLYNRSGQPTSLFRSEPVQRVVSSPKPSTADQQQTEDTVTLSQEGLEKSQQQNTSTTASQGETPSASSQAGREADGQSSNPQALTVEEEKMVQDLKQRNREVQAHERAHLGAAGQYAKGGASFTYQQGPDGRRYAIGGEVPIDVSAEKTPEETIQKMQIIKRAAMAPAEPSSADRSIAANASATEARARQELQAEQMEASASESSPEDSAEAENDSVAAATPLKPANHVGIDVTA